MNIIKLFLLACIYLSVWTFSAVAAPIWSHSTFWSRDSKPALPWAKNRQITIKNNKLFLSGLDGIVGYEFKNGKYQKLFERKFESLFFAVYFKEKFVVLDKEGLAIWDPKDDTIRRSGKLKNCHLGYNFPIAALSESDNKIIIAIPSALIMFDPESFALKSLNIRMKGSKGSLVAHPSGSVYIANNNLLYCYKNGKIEQVKLPDNFKQKECFNIGISPEGKYLYFGSPLTAYDIEKAKVVRQLKNINLIRWGYAIDTKRNLLFAASWRNMHVFSNADNPEKWQEINWLSSTNKAHLFTHRDLAPASHLGSLAYLPQTNELLFASRLGITICGQTPHTGNLLKENDYHKYEFNSKNIKGNTTLHNFLKKNQMIAAWATSSHAITDESLENYKKTGINTLIYNPFQIEHGQFYPPHNVRATVLELGKSCQKHNIQLLICITPYHISINNSVKNFRYFISKDGQTGRRLIKARNKLYTQLNYPCYLDEQYSQKGGLEYNMVEFAKLAKQVPIAGIFFELGDGFQYTNIKRGFCFCDHCFNNFVMQKKLSPPKDLAKAKRYSWLSKKHLINSYRNYMTVELAALCRRGVKAMRKFSDNMATGVMLPETAEDYTNIWLFNAFIDGFQTKNNPVVVFSEQTYALPYMADLCNRLAEKWRKAGRDVILIPGLVNFWHKPQKLFERSSEYLKYNPGIYYYQNYRWYNSRLNEKFYSPLNKFEKGTYTIKDYIDALQPLAD